MPTKTEPLSAAEAAEQPLPSLGSAIWTALRGSRQDFTRLPLPRAILLLALPMALELIMESLFGVVDIYFVGKLGPEAVATVGLTQSLIILVFAIAMGLSVGAAAMVSRRIGEGDERGAATAAAQAIAVGASFAVPISIIGAVFAPKLLTLMGGTPDVVAGAPYTSVLFGGSITIFLLFLNNAIFRGAGDAAIAMRSLWLANWINIFLDPCLIFGFGPFPEMGLAGAAAATTIGRGIGVLFQLWVLAKGQRRVELHSSDLGLNGPVLKRLLRISAPGMMQFFVGTASWLGIVRIVAMFGDETLAGYTIAIRVIHFAILPSWGMSNAAATLVGQNLGARAPDRAERAVWLTGRYNLIFLGSMAVLFNVFAQDFISFFNANPEVVRAGVTALRVSSFAYCFSAYVMVFSQAFNGAGDSDTPTKINVVVLWMWQLPLAYTFAHVLGYGLAGAMAAIVIAMATWAAVGAWFFKRGSWKTHVA